MQRVQLVAVDLDGTLLNDQKELSPGNRAAMERAIAAGVTVVPTTGRPFSGFPQALREVRGLQYTITANGAAIYRLRDGACIYEAAMSLDVIRPLVAAIDRMDVVIGCFVDGQGYMDRRSEALVPCLHMSGPVERYVRTSRRVVPEILAHLTRMNRPVQKITVNFRPENMEREKARLTALLAPHPELNAVSGGEHSVEISASAAAKGNALRWLARALGLAGTMACGDTENDLDMIRKADIGVAMANSEPVLLAEADYVTAGNNDDGVARAIERFALGD